MALKFLSRRSMKGEKATLGTSFWSNFTITGAIRIFFRFFQFVLGITVIALYAIDLDRARKQGKYVDSKWVWGVVCGTLGAITSLVFMLPLVKSWFFFYLDAFIFLCYLIAFGIFGKMYIPENPEGNSGVKRMKNAVWVLLTNMLLWLFTAVYGAIVFWKNRKKWLSFDVEVTLWGRQRKRPVFVLETVKPSKPIHTPASQDQSTLKSPEHAARRVSYLPQRRTTPPLAQHPAPQPPASAAHPPRTIFIPAQLPANFRIPPPPDYLNPMRIPNPTTANDQHLQRPQRSVPPRRPVPPPPPQPPCRHVPYLLAPRFTTPLQKLDEDPEDGAVDLLTSFQHWLSSLSEHMIPIPFREILA